MPLGFTPEQDRHILDPTRKRKPKPQPTAPTPEPTPAPTTPLDGGPFKGLSPVDKGGAYTPTSTAPTTSSDQQNALTIMDGILAEYGLQSLSSVVLGYVQQGYNSDAINVLIQQTPEWQQRFAGNVLRQKAGLAPLSPSEYLANEAQYAQVIRAYGLPAGFYDTNDQFAKWIGDNVSPDEIQTRVQQAADFAYSKDPGVLAGLAAQGIDPGQVFAYFLDTDKALPILQNTYNAVGIGAAAADQNLTLSGADAQRYASLGVTASQARQRYQQIAQTLPGAKTLADIYHQAYGQQDLENELLGSSGAAALERQHLVNMEEASFTGSGGVDSTSSAGMQSNREGQF